MRDDPPSAGPRSRYRAALVLLLCGLVATGSVFVAAWRQNRTALELQLRKDVEVGTRSFEFGFIDYLDIVLLVQAYADGSGGAPHSPILRQYLAKIVEGRKGVRAVAWIQRVSRDARAAFEAAAREAGFPDYVISERASDGRRAPAGIRDEYFPVFDVEPLAPNRPTLGFDLASDPLRGELLRRARDTGEPAASARGRLIESPAEPGLIVVAPVYGTQSVPKTVEDRRTALVGYAVGAFSLHGMIDDMAEQTGALRGFDQYYFEGGTARTESFIFAHRFGKTGENETPPAWDAARAASGITTVVTVADRKWTIVSIPVDDPFGRPGPLAWAVLLVGALGTGMVSLRFFTAARRTGQLLALTDSLRESTASLEQEVAERKKIQEKLATASAIVENSTTVISRWRFDPSGLDRPAEYLSSNFAQFGHAAEDLMSGRISFTRDVVHPDDRERVAAEMRATLAQRRPEAGTEFRILAKDGTVHWIESHITFDWNDTRDGVLAEGMLRDITERRRAQNALRETLERRQRQFEVVGAVAQLEGLVSGDVEAVARSATELVAKAAGCERVNVWLFDEGETELRCIDLYEAAAGRHSSGMVLREKEFGPEFKVIKSSKFVDADDPLTDPRTAGYVASYVKPLHITSLLDVVIGASGRNFGLLRLEHVDKKHHWEPDEIAFAAQVADKIAFALGSRARRQVEGKIRASEAALETAQAIAHVGSWDLDLATRAVVWSRETHRIFGVDPASFTPSLEALLARMVPDDRPGFEKSFAEAIAQRRGHDIEYRIRLDDGRIKWLHDRGETICDAEGQPARLVGTVQDITDRRGAEDVLRRERDFSTALIDGVPGIFFVLDRHGRSVRFNANVLTITGRSSEELAGADALDYVALADREKVRDKMREVFERGSATHEFGIVHRDGDVRHFSVIARRIGLDSGPGLLAIGVDVTEARQAERLLRESQERFRGLVENIVDWVWEMDPEFRYTYASPNCFELFGYTPDELLGRSAFEFMAPEDAKRTAEETADLFAQRRPMLRYVTTFIHKSGRAVVIETNATPFFDAEGRYCGYRGIDRDITQRTMMDAVLRNSEEKLRTIFGAVSDGIFITDPATGKFIDANRSGCEMFGYSRDELLGLDIRDLSSGIPPYDRAAAAKALEDLREGADFEWQAKTKNGRIFWIEIIVRWVPFGGRQMLLSSVRDISERKRVTEALLESETRFRTVAETAQDAIISIDAGGAVRYWNRAAERILGYTAQEAIGKSVHDWLTPERYREKAHDGLRTFASTGQGPVIGKTVELAAIRKDGVEIPIEISIAGMQLAGEWNAVAVFRDISERKRSESQILQMARFDALTGLANRRVFAEAVQQAIARAERGGKGFAILYLDLDHFKDVNDTLGHPVGDLLLKSVADRLKACVRQTDTVARFGGDEFAVLAADISDPTDAGVLGEKILATVSRPVTLDGKEIRSGTSVGIAVYGPDAPEAELLLTHADVALYRAKSEGRGTYRFFTDSMDADVRKRVKLDADLRTAIESNQMFLVYQPQVEASTGRIVGVEALVRWRHPERGIVSPADFIPAAEKNGLIVPLGRWVLEETCRQAKAWRAAGIAPPVIGVNVSALQFKTPRELEKSIADALDQNELPAETLELELTESVLMKASSEHNDVLLSLRRRGLRIAIDDFGTGFSSLEYLRRFPVDRIKIAQAFIIDLVTAAGDAAIVKAAIGLARELGINIIAEGVEAEAQLRLLQAWGCRDVQGYFYSKPLAPAALEPLLREGRIKPAATRAAEPSVAAV